MAPWFDISEVGQDIFCIQESVHVQSFLVNGRHSSLLIDTGMGFLNIRRAIAPLLKPHLQVVNTHWHFDHIGGNNLFPRIGISPLEAPLIQKPIPASLLVPFYIELCREWESPLPEAESGFNAEEYAIDGFNGEIEPLEDGARIDLGGRHLTVIETPGHTHGSLSFYDSLTQGLFTGDFVYDGSLYAQFTDSDLVAYRDSIHRLSTDYKSISRLYTGHNRPCLEPEHIERIHDLFQAMDQGKTDIAPTQEVWGQCIRHEFQGVRILVPPEGSSGYRPVGGPV